MLQGEEKLLYNPLEENDFKYEFFVPINESEDSDEETTPSQNPSKRSEDKQDESNASSQNDEDDDETPSLEMKVTYENNDLRIAFYYTTPDERWFMVKGKDPTVKATFKYANPSLPLTFLDIRINPETEGLPENLFQIWSQGLNEGEFNSFSDDLMLRYLNEVPWEQDSWNHFISLSTKIAATEVAVDTKDQEKNGNPLEDIKIEQKMYEKLFENQNVTKELSDFTLEAEDSYNETVEMYINDKISNMKMFIESAEDKEYDESLDQLIADLVSELKEHDYPGVVADSLQDTTKVNFDYYFSEVGTDEDEQLVITLPYYIGMVAEEIRREEGLSWNYQQYAATIQEDSEQNAISSASEALMKVLKDTLRAISPHFKMKEEVEQKIDPLILKLQENLVGGNVTANSIEETLNKEVNKLIGYLNEIKLEDPFYVQTESVIVDSLEEYIKEFMKQHSLDYKKMGRIFYSWMHSGNHPDHQALFGFQFSPFGLVNRRLVLV